jgi:hypothetical protein
MNIRPFKHAALFLVLTHCALAQNTHLDFRNAIVVYNHSTFEQDKGRPVVSNSTLSAYTDSRLQVLHPTIAFRWRTKAINFQEIELSNLLVRSVDYRLENYDTSGAFIGASGNVFVSSEIQLRYEYLLTFAKSKEKKLVPAIGFGARPGYSRTEVKYYSKAFYPNSVDRISIEFQVTPRLTYFFNEKLFFDANVPIDIFYVNAYIYKQENPAVPKHLQSYSNFDFEALPYMLNLRLGLGFKL